MSLVWDKYPKGGSELIVFLKLADWADDIGGRIFPSVGTVAEFTRIKPAQARRRMHNLIEDGWLFVTGNVFGGKPGKSRHYQINIQKLFQAPYASRGIESLRATQKGSPTQKERAPLQDREGSPTGEGRATPQGSLSITYPSLSIKSTSELFGSYPQGEKCPLDLTVAEWMLKKVLVINPDQMQPDIKKWALEIKRIRERDGKTTQQIVALYNFANKHNFWFKRILSPFSLRKHWNKLSVDKKHPEKNEANKKPTLKKNHITDIKNQAKKLGVKQFHSEGWNEFAERVIEHAEAQGMM